MVDRRISDLTAASTALLTHQFPVRDPALSTANQNQRLNLQQLHFVNELVTTAANDGIVDATAQLQTDITAAISAGAVLRIPRGTYKVTPATLGGITINSPLTIIADPKAVIKCTAGSYSTVSMFRIKSSGVTIIGGDWDWNSAGASALSAILWFGDDDVATEYVDCVIRDGTYRNAVYACLEIENTAIVIDNCRFLDNLSGDINVQHAGGSVPRVTVRDNYFRCGAANYEAINVVNLSGATKTLKNILIVGNMIEGHRTPSVESCAIQVWANSSNYAPGPLVVANNIIIGFKIGISTAFCTDGAIVGNVVVGSTLIAYEMAGYSLMCSGNVCEGELSTQYGFTADGAPRGVFAGNISRDCTLYDYSVTNGGSNDVLFVGCHAYHSGAAATSSAFAIFGINSVTIIGCHVDFSAVSSGPPLGVYVVDAGNLTIEGSYFNLGSSSLTFGLVYIDNSTGTTRDNIKVKSNQFINAGAIPSGRVRLIGTSYGTNIDVEGLASAAVTQATSKATAIAQTNAFQADITMNNAALNAATIVSFSWPQAYVTAADNVTVRHVSGGTIGAYSVHAVAGAGTITVYVRNNTAGNLSEAIVLRCVVDKSKER